MVTLITSPISSINKLQIVQGGYGYRIVYHAIILSADVSTEDSKNPKAHKTLRPEDQRTFLSHHTQSMRLIIKHLK